MSVACINGANLRYRQCGSGDDVVLVHGLAANRAFWGLDLVSTLARSYRVTTFDLRGHGHSEMTTAGYHMEDLVADLAGLFDHLDIGSVHLVGHSWGGTVALQFALSQPWRIATLAVADSRVRALQPRAALTQQEDWPALKGRLARCGVVVADDEPEVGICLLEALATPHWDGARRRFVERGSFVPFAGGGSKRAALHWRRLLAETTAKDDFRRGDDIDPDQLRWFDRPVLLVYGERSYNRRSCQALAALLPDCRVAVSPSAGHFHPATQPRFFQDALLGFFDEQSAQRRGELVA